MPDPFHRRQEKHNYRDDQRHATRHLQITGLIHQVHSLRHQVNCPTNHKHQSRVYKMFSHCRLRLGPFLKARRAWCTYMGELSIRKYPRASNLATGIIASQLAGANQQTIISDLPSGVARCLTNEAVRGFRSCENVCSKKNWLEYRGPQRAVESREPAQRIADE